MRINHGSLQTKSRRLLAGFAVIALAAIFTLAGCDPDDGKEDTPANQNPAGGGPESLATTAQKADALAKLDEIIAYSGTQEIIKTWAQSYKATVEATSQNLWLMGHASDYIASINTAITWIKTRGPLWTTRVEGSNFPTFDIAYGNGKWVAVGSTNTMATSTDGVTWQQGAGISGFASLMSIAYGGNKFIAVDNGGRRAYSEYGTNWTQVSSSPGEVTAIAYGGNRWVAVYYRGMQTSTDGIDWDYVTISSDFDLQSYNAGIAYGGSRWVAGAKNGKLAWSDNGTDWTVISGGTGAGQSGISTDSDITGIAYGGGKFIAFGGGMAYSSNGAEWTAFSNSAIFTSVPAVNIAYGGAAGSARFVAVLNTATGEFAYSNVME